MHWIHKNTSENKNLNSPGLQAYLYFKTVKYNWHNGKHYMNSFLTFHRFQFKLTRVFLLEHNTWDWSICTNTCVCLLSAYFLWCPIKYLNPTLFNELHYLDSLHAVSPLALSAHTYCTHSLAVWHEQNGQWLTGQPLQPFAIHFPLCVLCRITE